MYISSTTYESLGYPYAGEYVVATFLAMCGFRLGAAHLKDIVAAVAEVAMAANKTTMTEKWEEVGGSGGGGGGLSNA